tara:strand:+ start:126327 stop:127181 length:855 start_codon:yes stop_codon:yes gene_type:complete
MLSKSRTIAKPSRAGIFARNWKRFGCVAGWFVTLTITMVMAIPFVMGLLWLQPYIRIDELRDERLCIVPVLVALWYVPSRVRPWIGYAFGSRSGNRRFGRRVIPESIAFLQDDLRRWIIALLTAQLLSLAVAYWGLAEADRTLGLIRSFHWLILIPLAFGVIGLVFAYLGKVIFLQTRGRKRGVWKVNRRRGIPLRDFIWKWDTTTRQIFERCRISRRVAGAFTAVTLSSTACYAAMGCLTSLLAPHYGIAITFNLFSVAATAWFWPTPKRLVKWTARIIDRAP